MRYTVLLIICFVIAQASNGRAQVWKQVKQKLENKVNKKVDEVLDGKSNGKDTSGEQVGNKRGRVPNLEEVYAFTPGDSVIFEDQFSSDTPGTMPKHWKSSGGGSVVAISGTAGKWLALAQQATYRIDSLLPMPDNFTIEFDLLTRSEEAKDIGSMRFGFAKDNSARSYIMDAYNDNAITSCELHFHNEEVINSSSDTEIYNTVDFPFANYSNILIHVAIAVNGQHMQVYVNKAKLLDTDMFSPEVVKYFYISAPFEYDANAKIYFGNFVLAK